MGRMAGVLDDPPGFPCTPPGVDVLEGGKLTCNNVVGSSHDPLQSFAVASGAVSKPGKVNVDQQIFGYPRSSKYLILCSAQEIN